MNLQDIERINAATLSKLRDTPGQCQPLHDPFLGFYDVDLFECPPFVMFTADDCPRAWDILFHRRFEPTSMKLWCRLAPQASGIFDIGAHVGVYSLAAAALRKDIDIHAFEPNPYASARLRLHKMINGFSNIVENRIALFNEEGSTTLTCSTLKGYVISSGGSIRVIGEKEASDFRVDRFLVEVAILDNLPASKKIGDRGLIKIDVEGVEFGVIRGMPRVLAHRPDIILESFDAESCHGISEKLLPLGYKAYLIREKEGVLEPQERLQARAESSDFNQFLSVRSYEDLMTLMQ